MKLKIRLPDIKAAIEYHVLNNVIRDDNEIISMEGLPTSIVIEIKSPDELDYDDLDEDDGFDDENPGDINEDGDLDQEGDDEDEENE